MIFRYLIFARSFGIVHDTESHCKKKKVVKKGYVVIDQSRCKGCGLCVEVCPKGLILIARELNLTGYYPAEYKGDRGKNPEGCTGCALCAVVCPEVACEVYRE